MKFTLQILIVLLFVSCTGGTVSKTSNIKKVKKIRNDIDDQHLKGPVKSFTVIEYKYVAQSRPDHKQLTSKTIGTFNKDGNLNYMLFYNEYGSLDHKWIYRYNDKGRKMKMDIYNAYDTLKGIVIYKYDSRGQNIGSGDYTVDSILKKIEICKYDEYGNEIEEISLNPDGSLDYRYTKKYDDNGNIIEQQSYHADNKPGSKVTFYYDEKENLVEMKYSFRFSVSSVKYKQENFDKYGNCLKETSYSNNKPENITEQIIEYY